MGGAGGVGLYDPLGFFQHPVAVF